MNIKNKNKNKENKKKLNHVFFFFEVFFTWKYIKIIFYHIFLKFLQHQIKIIIK